MYQIILSQTAHSQLLKLDRQLQERMLSVFERIKTRPERYVQKLVGDDSYKLRIGDYRAILDMDQEKRLITITKIGHRKNIYDGL